MAEPHAIPELQPCQAGPANGQGPSGRGWMASVPTDLRDRVHSGMRWTVWLTALAAPFTYGSRILLARVGPATIGAYGLLSVYIAVVTCIFYFGGDSVAIKFLPELDPPKRVSFLFSYFFIICVSIVPWLALATLFPQGLHYLFGRDTDKGFLLLVLCFAPLPILSSVIQAAMKANLDFRHPQLLVRMVTIGSFLAYAFLFFFERHWFSAHSAAAIWCVYLSLATLGIALGSHWLRKATFIRDPQESLRLRFWLPRGFWAYACGTQSISFIGLLQGLDFILVLDFGGLRTLGKYVTITTLALTIPLISRFFYDTLLPSLTNLLAAGNQEAAGEVFRAHMRLLLLVIAGGSCALIFLASPLLALFGPPYEPFAFHVLVLAALVGIANPGATGGTLLSAIGKPHRAAWASLFQAGLNVGLFFALWPRFHLLGAVLALGISQALGRGLLLLVAAWSVPFHTRVARDYARLSLVVGTAGTVAWIWKPQSWGAGLVGGFLSALLFLLIGRYRWTECQNLWRWIAPSPSAAWDAGRRLFSSL